MERIVIIPVLNPDKNLIDIVERNWELENLTVVVDDGSGEEYQKLFWKIAEKAVVLHHKENKGKGEAIKTGLRYIKREFWEDKVIGIMDGDGQHLPEDMDRILIKAEENPDALILGTRRIDREMPWISRTGNKITRIVFHMVTGQTVSDTQTGLRAFSGSLLDFMESISGSRYEYEMNVLIACGKKPVPIVEVPVTTIYHDRRNSCSHFRKVRDSVRIYRDMFRFTLSSLTSFVLDYTLFVLLTFLMPKGLFWALAANVAARLVSGYYNYTMNCRFVFGVKRDLRTAADYIGLALLILLLNNLFLTFFMEICYIPPRQAKMITEISLFLISWLVQKKIIFSKISEQKAIPLRRVEKW